MVFAHKSDKSKFNLGDESDLEGIGDGTAFGAIKYVKNNSAIIGSMQIFAGSTIPNGYLLCDGQAISRTTYSDLFKVIGTTWGSGDGSTTFNVPDMREVAPVGVGTSTRTEGNHDEFTLGEFKDDQLQNHTQSVSAAAASSWIHPNGIAPENYGYYTAANTTRSATTITAGRHGDVTRGKRIGVNYIIKY